MSARHRDVGIALLLLLLPTAALAPTWARGRLIGGVEAAVTDLGLRQAVWSSWRSGETPGWNASSFSGTPLLAAYRPAALSPTVVLLSSLPPFEAYQALLLASLWATALLFFIHLRRIGVRRPGALVGGLCLGLGPYVVARLGDGATVMALPFLPLLLIVLEAELTRPRPLLLALATAALLLQGSSVVALTGLLLVGARLVVVAVAARRRAVWAVFAVLAGVLLAAPQLLPTVLAARDAGGWPEWSTRAPLNVAEMVVHYASHTPAPALAIAAVLLALKNRWVRTWLVALAMGITLLAATEGGWHEIGALLFDLALAALAAVSISHQWAYRFELSGRRQRIAFLLVTLASAAALSVSTTLTGPLPEVLAGAVGVMAVALVLSFAWAESSSATVASMWLLPLAVSFALQLEARAPWSDAPTKADVMSGPLERRALDRAIAIRPYERIVSLARGGAPSEQLALGWGNLGSLVARRSANGIDPFVPARRRAAWDGMTTGGALPDALFRTDPGRLELLGVHWVQVPASSLVAPSDSLGLGDLLGLTLEPGRPLRIPLPLSRATEVRLSTALAFGEDVPQGQPVAQLGVHLGSGRRVVFPLRAGEETAEWAFDREDVSARVKHRRPQIVEDVQAGAFVGHRYLSVLRLPGPLAIDALELVALPGRPRLSVFRIGLFDGTSNSVRPVSAVASYVSDTLRLREASWTPFIRLLEVTHGLGRAAVVRELRRAPDDAALQADLSFPTLRGIDARTTAVGRASDWEGITIPAGARPSRPLLTTDRPGHVELRAEGPGLLVVTETWAPGWGAEVDGRAVALREVNGPSMGLVLSPGTHLVRLQFKTPGLRLGLLVAALAGALLLAWSFVLLRFDPRRERMLASTVSVGSKP